MKKNYIFKSVIVFFALILLTQSAYCAIDISEFKKIKNVIHRPVKNKETKENKKLKKQKKAKSLEFKETDLDNSAFSLFEDVDTSSKYTPLKKKEENLSNSNDTKKINKKTKFHLFQRKPKQQAEDNLQNETVEEVPITQDENFTYYNDEDNLVYIKEVEIYGNNLLDINYVRNLISSKEGSIYKRAGVSNDLKILYNTGFFTQNLRALPIKIDERNVRLRIILEENPPIAGFNVVGVNSIPIKEIMDVLSQYKGLPQNILSINNAINDIQEIYASKGYILARVSKVVDDPDGYVNILIDEGVIGDIIVEGNNKTKDFIVKRNIFLQPGYVYNENTMRSDILRLMGTQAFKDVQRELKKDDRTGLYDVYIALEEQRTGKISVGVGIDSSSGFFGSVGFGENNFRGLGQKLNLNLMAGTGILMNDSSVMRKANLQGEISFLEPMFKRENQSLNVRAFARYYGSYQVPLAIEKRFGGEFTLARKFKTFKNLSGSIGFGVEEISLDEGDKKTIRRKYEKHNIDFANRREELKGGFYVKITPALTYDTRDNIVNARKGVFARITFEENIGISGSTYGKLYGVIRKFTPVGKKSSFVLTAKAGGNVHGKMPEFAGFSLGGPYSIRGFNISEVGVGTGYMMGSAEYRVPIPFIDRLTSNSFLNNLRLAGFVDAGKLFDRSIGSRIYDKPGYAITAGIGLRVFIPGLGPINLDYGIPLTNTMGAHRKGGFFTFGMGEMY